MWNVYDLAIFNYIFSSREGVGSLGAGSSRGECSALSFFLRLSEFLSAPGLETMSLRSALPDY